MIRKHRINIDQFVYIYLPSHQRQPVRVKLFQVLSYPYAVLMEDWMDWRDGAIIAANVTGETASLEWYLNYLFDPDEERIYIDTNDKDGLPFGLRASGSDEQAIGLRGDLASAAAMPLRGYDAELGTKSFGVFIPSELNDQADAIGAIVNRYKLAGKTFLILNP